MTSRVIVPEIIGEEPQRHPHHRTGRPPFQRPAVGLRSLLRALAAGVVLVAGVATIMVLGGFFLVVIGIVLLVAWLASIFGGRKIRSGETATFRSTEREGPTGRAIFIERHYSGTQDSKHEDPLR